MIYGASLVSGQLIDQQKGVSIVSGVNLHVLVVDEQGNEVVATLEITGGSDIDGLYSGYSDYPFSVGDNVNVSISASANGYNSTTIVDSYVENSFYDIIIVLTTDQCSINEIGRSFVKKVVLPTVQEVDRGYKECCYTNTVLASIDSTDYQKNDFTGFYEIRQTSSDTCDFVLKDISTDTEVEVVDSELGDYLPYGSIDGNTELTVFVVDWQKVLNAHGESNYRILKRIVVAGIEVEIESNTYTLQTYSQVLAENTIRLDCQMNGEMVKENVNFYNSGFKTSVRFMGFFGSRNPKYTQDNLLRRDYSVEQITMTQENEYVLQSNLLPECITEEVYDFILFGDRLLVNDYNSNNHSYKYSKFEVELTGNKGAKYYSTTRDSKINLTFKDRFDNKRKINC